MADAPQPPDEQTLLGRLRMDLGIARTIGRKGPKCGSGQTGVVFRAMDGELGRAVAIKLLHRLSREAEPEFVEGEPLDVWRARMQPGWREVLAVYLQAGDGLAAIHANGWLYRDFKPESGWMSQVPVNTRVSRLRRSHVPILYQAEEPVKRSGPGPSESRVHPRAPRGACAADLNIDNLTHKGASTENTGNLRLRQ